MSDHQMILSYQKKEFTEFEASNPLSVVKFYNQLEQLDIFCELDLNGNFDPNVNFACFI